jgi:hypothetical protein
MAFMTNTQRIEVLEAKVAELEAAMAKMNPSLSSAHLSSIPSSPPLDEAGRQHSRFGRRFA